MRTFDSSFRPCVALFNNGNSSTKREAPVPAGAPLLKRLVAGDEPSTRLLLPVLLMLWMGTLSMSALTLLSTNQLVFVNVDHAPMGVCSTMSYGYKGDVCGVGTSTAYYPYWNPSGGGDGGVLIALSGSFGLKLLPFVLSAASISTFA